MIKEILKNQKGAATLVLAIVMSIVIVIISLSIALTSISSNQIRINQNKGFETTTNLDGCAEEALARLSIDEQYSGGQITIGNTTCTLTVTGYDPENPTPARTIDVSAVNGDHSIDLEIQANISPEFEITSWQIQNP